MKKCSNCLYSDVDGAEEPCDTCTADGSNWVSMRALDIQISGNHYKDLAIQPVEYIYANGIGYFEGNVIKYVSRWRNKNGIKDLEKAKHYIDLLIELEGKRNDKGNSDV